MSDTDKERNETEAVAAEEESTIPEPKKKKKRRKLPYILLSIFILLIVGGVGFYEYSNTPEFCNSCHHMTPYYEAWKTSTHNFVPCVDCHISPRDGAKWEAKVQGMLQALKYITRRYSSKPYAEIEDDSCLRSGCHSRRTVEGHSTEEFKNHVVFDHAPHLLEVRRGKHLRCTSCHAQIVVGNHMEVTTTTCYLCHFKESDAYDVAELSSCTLCHKRLPEETVKHKVMDPSDPTKIIDTVYFNHGDFIGERNINCQSCHRNVVQGAGKAKEERCLTCHNDPANLDRIGEIDFIHDNHITEHNVTCERCHEEIKHEVTSRTMTLVQSCSQCHISTHGGQREMFMGTGGRGIEEPMPGTMYRTMVDCSGCHVGSNGGTDDERHIAGFTRVVSYDGCANCHGEYSEDYEEAFEEYMLEVRERLPELKLTLAQARSALRSLRSSDKRAELEKLLADAEYNVKLVELSRGWAHNWEYSGALLDLVEDNLQEVIEGSR